MKMLFRAQNSWERLSICIGSSAYAGALSERSRNGPHKSCRMFDKDKIGGRKLRICGEASIAFTKDQLLG
jgi:hypothetical protein